MMSTTLGEEIQKVISKALPGLLEEKKEQLLQRLLSWGVESTDDLKYVEGAPGVDLSDLLPPIQIRKLLDSFMRGYFYILYMYKFMCMYIYVCVCIKYIFCYTVKSYFIFLIIDQNISTVA